METKPLIEVEDLALRFEGRDVLTGFSLRVAAGEKVILTGASGAGKTSLLRCLLGFCQPYAGVVRIGGENVEPHRIWRLRQRLACVQQEPDLGDGTVRECIRRPFAYRANRHLDGNEEKSQSLLTRFGLPDGTLDQDISRLSGGEKQRVAIVIAILLERELILLDEPTSALDRESGDRVADYFRTDCPGAVLAVAHHPDRFPIGGRIVKMGEGEE